MHGVLQVGALPRVTERWGPQSTGAGGKRLVNQRYPRASGAQSPEHLEKHPPTKAAGLILDT